MSIGTTRPSTQIQDSSGTVATVDRKGIRGLVETSDSELLDAMAEVITLLKEIKLVLQDMDT